ncbi:c-type cytochrome [Aestuariibacter sp. GS-14]|uniref:c-type cytochrome n=1 Tax=Alteromonadaceae TaxID=72275 RepID=UPI00112B8B80|nr:c-type cytochrome [Aestuariibacter sp. GS-14]TPV59856.1 c-type cytochrome [Aestuariibacter sp. GS-14]
MKLGKFGLVSALACAASIAHAGQAESQDVKMINLAHQSGCVTCHAISGAGKGPNGLKPIGPAWQDVAKKYGNDPDAKAALVTTVLNGSSPYQSHWKGEVSGVAMPPNSVVLSKEQANELVGWILHLAD